MAAFSVPTTVQHLRATLESRATPERARQERAYLKSELEFLGAGMPAIRLTAREWLAEDTERSLSAVWRVVEALWRTKVHDCWQLGTAILERRARDLRPLDLPRVERLLRRGQSWAHIDWLATAVAAPVVWQLPDPHAQLRRWARDKSFWVRRTALLCYLPRVRKHPSEIGSFCDLAEPLLDEREFFIRKAIGWVLREAGRRDPQTVGDFVAAHLARVSAVTFREAVKYLPVKRREALTRERTRSAKSRSAATMDS